MQLIVVALKASLAHLELNAESSVKLLDLIPPYPAPLVT